jgi:hypothetical protein
MFPCDKPTLVKRKKKQNQLIPKMLRCIKVQAINPIPLKGGDESPEMLPKSSEINMDST